MTEQTKTHYRKAFNSPYLSSADIVGPTVLTIEKVVLSNDQTKKTKDQFNTAYFAEKHLRPGEKLKPMILNASNSRTMYLLTGSHYIEDWSGTRVTIYVDQNVRFGRDTVEGLRISSQEPPMGKKLLTKDNTQTWGRAVNYYRDNGNISKVLETWDISEQDKQAIANEAANV